MQELPREVRAGMNNDDTEKRDVAPYCGGCGHRFFNEPYLTQEEADKQAESRRCHYCIEEAAEKDK